MTECPDCGRPTRSYGECADDDGYCYAHVEADSEIINCRELVIAQLKSRLALAMAVVEAAVVMRSFVEDGLFLKDVDDFDSALSELRLAERGAPVNNDNNPAGKTP